ncbi:Basement membrane proteoglycan [Trichinella pseudospiralis]|uniref:Basement membrane proteoglycan n=1 Tax=Trichinella pseudospiralis TaxID=6337 RepID=A0A0V1FWL4_TRIPS|nr:Basement membrane proteoglycan [Trichinella pseudospiralis]
MLPTMRPTCRFRTTLIFLSFLYTSLLAYDYHASTNATAWHSIFNAAFFLILENRQDIYFVGTADNDDATDPMEFIEVTPHQQTVSEGEEVTFECQPRNIRHRVHIEWRRLHGRLPPKAIIRRGRLTIPNVHMEDAGVYICKVSSIFIPKEAEVHLNVHGRNGGLREQTGPSRCLEGEATCQNGECVKREYICDGQRDCRDGSDEFNCPAPQACEPNEYQCANKNCIQKMWICDGDDDCGDGSDEQNCGTRLPGQPCAPYEFQCKSGSQCVPASFQCDGQNDCMDGSDEIGCAAPVCVQLPQRELTVDCGSTIVITCRAVGVPTPYINWRLNWGPTCGQPRCVQTSDQGFGKLVIKGAREEDQGAYTCEAINSKGRILATPDAIVTVRCQQPSVISRCDAAGTLTQDPATGSCQCKHYTVGPTCAQCSPGSFYLSPRNPYGCVQCFCSGVTKSCQSSSWHRTQERLTFTSSTNGVTISDFMEKQIETAPRLDLRPYGYITYGGPFFDVVYWRLPARMLGNKITAYGGSLKFKLQFECTGQMYTQPLVVMKGNEITLIAHAKTELRPGKENEISIDIYETSFEREDGQPSTREHLLMTLANLDSLLIRATHCANQKESRLGEISLDIAVDRDTQQEVAFEVEQCHCPPGYKGLSCEECAPGYERSGGGLYLGLCEPVEAVTPVVPYTRCDPGGALSPTPDARTGQCACKSLTTGPQCNQCKQGSFFLNPRNPEGCLKCFCSGVTTQCDSSNLYRSQIFLRVGQQPELIEQLGVRTADRVGTFRPSSRPMVDSSRSISFSGFFEAPYMKALYLELPHYFLGNKITSYGGHLTISLRYRGSGRDNTEPEVILTGNDIMLNHRVRIPLTPDQDHAISVPLTENHWNREDGRMATREHFMMALAEVSSLMIKLSFKENMDHIAIRDIAMTVTTDRDGRERAWEVEQCSCPREYLGTSCEECAPGYTRSEGGFYLGTCVPCDCHGHADRCDPKTGICYNCRHNTEGDHCERCQKGFEGDATRGTPNDCFTRATPPPCECHNHSPRGCDPYGRCLRCEHNTEGIHCERCKPGYFGDARSGTPFDCRPCPCPGARECFLDSDGQVTCRGCPAGFTGRLCQECAPGYQKDPVDPQRCKPIGELRVVIQPPKRVEVEEGTTAVFRCHAEGEAGEPVTLKWTRPTHPSLPVNSIERNGILTLYSVTTADSGIYQCSGVVGPHYASDDAELVVVKRMRGQRPTPTVQPQQQTIQIGQPFQIRCSAPGSPPPTITWQKEGDALPHDVELFDGILRQTLTALNEHLHELLLKKARVSRPQALVNPNELRVSSGERAQFQCYSPADVTYEWRAATGPLREGIEVSGGNLVFRTAQPQDSGYYYCTVRNPYGEDSITARLIVEDGMQKPRPFVEPSVLTVKVGDPAEFHCTADATPPPVITWGWSIPAGPLRPGIEQDRGRIYITNARKTDEGTYFCTASNQYGTESVPVTLYVEDGARGPSVQIEPTDRWEGRPGETFEFRCVASGTPQPHVSWSRENQMPFDRNVQDHGYGILRIVSFEELNVGNYVCTATNLMGTAKAVASVQSAGGLSVKIIPSLPRIEILEGQPLTLECIAEGTPKPKIEWIYDIGPSRGDVPDGYKPAKIEGRFIRHEAVSPANEGIYKCRASNEFQVKEAEIYVNVVSRLKRQVVITGGSERQAEFGDDVTLTCILPNPREKDMIWWTRIDGNLTERHEEQIAGILVIVDFQPQDVGIYECQSYDMNINEKSSSSQIKLYEARAEPSINLLRVDGPEIRVLSIGDTLNLKCQETVKAGNSVKSELKWFYLKSGYEEELPRGSIQDGSLLMRNVNLSDGGTYKCVRFLDGKRDGEYQVIVLITNTEEEPFDVYAKQGTEVQLHCPIYVLSGMLMVWSRKGELIPDTAVAEADELIIPDFQKHKSGTYICEAEFGSLRAKTYVRLMVSESDSTIEAHINVQPPEVKIGQNVSFQCTVKGDPDANIRWEKRGGHLPQSATTRDNMLTLQNVVHTDSGIYRCIASTRVGILTTDAVLHIGTPTALKLPKRKDDKIEYGVIGLQKRIVCPGRPSKSTTGTVLWMKDGAAVPSQFRQEDDVLVIPKFTGGDGGQYSCTVKTTNGYSVQFNITVIAEGYLQLRDLVPKFSSDSYIQLPGLPPSAYRAFDVQMSLKPTKQNGLLFYTAKEDGDEKGDFFAFGLQEGRLVLRFDLGDGVTELASTNPLSLNKWHKIFVKREFNKGLISLLGEQQWQRYSEGIETGLGLGESVFIGGLPNFDEIISGAGFKTGFSGVISSVVINDVPMNLGENLLNSNDIEQANTCSVNSCLNEAKCVPSDGDFGYKCQCKVNSVGTYCERRFKCNGDVCENGGFCSSASGSRKSCLCPANKTGDHCEQDYHVHGAAQFGSKESFIVLPKPENMARNFQLGMSIKPVSLHDSVLFYSANDLRGTGDYIGLVISEKNVELRYDSGLGSFRGHSPTELVTNEWYDIKVERKGSTFMLSVNGVATTLDVFYENGGLSLFTDVFIGGVYPDMYVAAGYGIKKSFIGCIEDTVFINDQKYRLIADSINSGNISSCRIDSEDGLCQTRPDGTLACSCPPGFTGDRCEIRETDGCSGNSCGAHGECSFVRGRQRCRCYVGFTGERCEQLAPIIHHAYFNGHSYLEFPRSLLPHMSTEDVETIEMKFITSEKEGLLLWHGRYPKSFGSGSDYMSVSITDGFLEFSYELGGGPLQIVSSIMVADGKEHRIQLVRKGRHGQMFLDDMEPEVGMSEGILAILNAEGNVFLGGVPDVSAITNGRFRKNFVGCISDVQFDGHQVKFLEDSLGGLDVVPCTNRFFQ